MSDIVQPSPHYRTVQLRVPHFSGGLAAAVVAVVLVVGALAWGGYHLYQVHARDAQARIETDASARELSARESARLDAAEDGLKTLGQTVDKALAAESSDAININGYLDNEGRLRTAFSQVGPDLDAFYGQPHVSYLSADRRRELDALRHRADAGAGQLAAVDAQIQQAAQHRQKLAQSEAAAAKAASARAAAARRAQEQEVSSSSAPSPASAVYYDGSPSPYYDYPYSYPYGYYGGPSIWIGGRWGGHGGWHGGGHGGHHH